MDLELTVVQRAKPELGYIAGLAIGEQLLAAAGGTSSHAPTILVSSDASHFEPRKTPRQLGLRDVVIAGDALWICGEYGQLAVSRDRGASWKLFDTGTDVCLFALALAADGAVWVVGDAGYVARVYDERLERLDFKTAARLAAIYCIRDEAIALGFDGVLYRWRAGVVEKVATGATKPLTALTITKHGSWLLTGDGGFLARSPDGAWFSKVKCDVEIDLEAITSLPDGRVVMVGDRGIVMVSADDGRTWTTIATEIVAHLWSVERFGAHGVLITGDEGLILKLAPPGDETWSDRINVFGGVKPLDAVFAAGPEGFIARLPSYVRAIEAEPLEHDAGPPSAEEFARIYGAPLPAEVQALFAATHGRDCFDELHLDAELLRDSGDDNLFERLLEAGLTDAFCGVFCIGSQRNGDTYHVELYEWDGPRQVLHYDHETHVFTGVVADSLDSLVYLAALSSAKETRQISDQAFDIGLRRLRGKVAPTWHFGVEDHDPEFVPLDARRRDTEFFFYRSRWIVALLENRELTDISDIPALFMPDFNQILPEEQLAARFEACEKVIPTALYSMWRAFLFDEPELARYLEIGRRHKSRLVRDAAKLVDQLREGRNQLGTIKDMRARLAAFRALDLDPRRADQRKAEAVAREQADATRRRDVEAELARVPRATWPELAWRWLDDGIAHRVLLEKMVEVPELAAQVAMLDELRGLPDDERELVLPHLAGVLAPELEALLVGSLVRDDDLGDVIAAAPEPGPAEDDGAKDDAGGEEDGEPSAAQIRAALSMTERALRIAPQDDDTQFTHAMLLLDADRAGIPGKRDALLHALPRFTIANRVNIAVRMAKQEHPAFGEALDAVLSAGALPTDEVADELLAELADAVLELMPERLGEVVPILPANVNLLSALAWKTVQAEEREQAIAIYERILDLPIPDEGDERVNYLRALNNACVQAHSAKAYDAAVRIADRAQPVAHENPYIYHSAACAYAAVGHYAKALEQVKLAMAHDYDHVSKVEVDEDLGALLEWPEFKALFRDWHARREGN